jgi:hypothetical protein
MGHMAGKRELQRFKGTIDDDAEGHGIVAKRLENEGDALDAEGDDAEGHRILNKRLENEGGALDAEGDDAEGHRILMKR